MIRNILEENDNVQPNDRTMEVLHREFPQCFNAEGKFDIAALQELLQDKVDLVKEGSGFNFLGKNYASLLNSMDTTTVLVPDTEHNEKPENKDSQNVYISGDNLDALKHLVKSYSGKVKCIYIDPPYNTGSDGFVYNDKFKFTAEELEEKLSISEEQAQRIFAMTTRGAASHAAWLTFMMPRLQYAKDLLSDDGVIFISIDDNEQANLKLLCDYVFGEENFIAQFLVKANPKGRQSDTFCATVHDYLLCYARNINQAQFIGMKLTEEQKKEYKYDDGDGRKYRFLGLRQRGSDSLREDRPDMFFPIYVNKDTEEISLEYREGWEEVIPRKSDGREGRWMWGKDKCKEEFVRLNARFVKKRGQYDIDVKDYLETDGEERTAKIKSFWESKSYNNEVGTKEVKALLEGDHASYPKSSQLICDVINSVVEDNDIIVDFFAGSGTTADSVMQTTSASGNNLKYILVQLPEDLDERIKTLSGSEAQKVLRLIDFLESNNHPHTLDYLAFERIKRAAKKIKEQNPLFAGDLGFKHYTLQEPDANTIDQMLKFEPTQMFGDNLLDKFGKDTVLFTYAMRDGYGLTPEFKEVKFGSYTAYLCGKHLYMLDSEFNVEEDLTDLVDTYNKDHSFPADNVVIFGYSFNFSQTDAIKKNLGTITDRNRINVDIRY